MLYISRQIGRNKWEITDTETGVSEVYTSSGIKELLEYNIEIKGVVKNEDYEGYFDVNVYKIKSTSSGAKLLFLHGVETVITDGVLQSFKTKNTLKQDLTIRLSDYCTKVGAYSFKEFDTEPNVYLTIKIDDNITFEQRWAQDFCINETKEDRGIKLDITEVTNKDIIKTVYKALSTKDNGLNCGKYLLDRIIDKNKSNALEYNIQNFMTHILVFDAMGNRKANHSYAFGFNYKKAYSNLLGQSVKRKKVSEIVIKKYYKTVEDFFTQAEYNFDHIDNYKKYLMNHNTLRSAYSSAANILTYADFTVDDDIKEDLKQEYLTSSFTLKKDKSGKYDNEMDRRHVYLFLLERTNLKYDELNVSYAFMSLFYSKSLDNGELYNKECKFISNLFRIIRDVRNRFDRSIG